MKAVFCSVALFVVAATCSPADVRNGDFSGGMAPWKAAWDTAVADGEAVLSDSQATHAFLFQSAAVTGSTQVSVSFDFLNTLSGTVPPGAFPDVFFASVYEVDVLADFVLERDRFDATHALMDLDHGGEYNVNGTVTTSSKGGEWKHFAGTITCSRNWAVIVFELHSLNDAGGDSSVRVDNVRVGEVAP